MPCKMDHNSECISLFIDICHLNDYQKLKSIRLTSVYVPSFLLIHLKPSAAEGPITLYQRDLLLAYREINSELADVLKYFYEHAVQWMSPVNVALSVFAEVSPYSIEAVKISHYPNSADARKLLQGGKAGLRDFFTSESKTAPCIVCSEVPVAHYKSIENNRATERLIGKLKGVVQNTILDSPLHPNKIDTRIHAFLCNME